MGYMITLMTLKLYCILFEIILYCTDLQFCQRLSLNSLVKYGLNAQSLGLK